MTAPRILSLDALRGFTIAAMIVVNFPGLESQVYFMLRHTVWNGLSITDQVAPYFLFVVGVSIALAYSKRLEDASPRGILYRKIFFRALKIYAVGMFLNLMPDFDFHNIRWTGTLHRIAFVFLFCALIYLNTSWKQQAWIAAVLLVGYWLLLCYVPTPGYGKVMLEPGKNIVAWVDSKWLPGRMWRGNWDPESILTTITSVVSGITGMLAGRLMLGNLPPNVKVNYLVTAGVFSAIAGFLWGLVFPVNENLWTSSFVLITSGFAAILFGVMYFLVDIQGIHRWTRPGIIFGSNAITAYFLGDVFALVFYELKIQGQSLNERAVNGMISFGLFPKFASLLYALAFVGILFIPLYWLFKKKIFIRL
jgi:predicted acyltransferase